MVGVRLLATASTLALSLLLACPTTAQEDPRLAVGEWEGPFASPGVGVHAALLHTGKVLLWGYDRDEHILLERRGGAWVVARSTESDPTFVASTNLFCSGLCQLADGRILATGGNRNVGATTYGLPSAEVFDPATETWSRLPDMRGGDRWYPSAVTREDGTALVYSGVYWTAGADSATNPVVELFRPTPLASWTQLDASLSYPDSFYPRLYLLQGGLVLSAGPANDVTGETWAFNVGLRSWLAHGGAMAASPGDGAASVLLPQDVPGTQRVLVLGGGPGDHPYRTSEAYDTRERAWFSGPRMSFERHHPNAVILPDGRVLVVGGATHGPSGDTAVVRECEIHDPFSPRYDPADPTIEVFRTVARLTESPAPGNLIGRGYHSTALLLPDGRVLAAGGDNNSQVESALRNNPTYEIYYPDYIFRSGGRRPVLVSATPSSLRPGDALSLSTPDALRIGEVSLVRLSAVTHSLNTDQRILFPVIESWSDGEVVVRLPSDPTILPPGYYMVFALDGARIPSESRIVQVRPLSP